jgi:glucose-6-phosphate 1-epimerase
VPVCFPQFNERGPLPKHGFARNLPWVAGEATAQAGAVQMALTLASSPATLALWPHDFCLQLTLTLAPGRLALDVAVDNTGTAPLRFMLALHTYFRVADIGQTRVDGLDGCASWDSLVDVHSHQQGAIQFTGEFDRVFGAAAAPLQFTDGHKTVQVAQSASLGNTVVWNPGAAKCATLADMPPDGYLQMLCIEAAQIDTPVTLAAGARWTGGQHLALV